MEKWILVGIRKGVDGKPDFIRVATYSNNQPITFDSEKDALRYAECRGMVETYGIKAVKVGPF